MSLAFALTPPRIRGIELLDDPASDPALALRSLRDVAAANRWFGGTRAVLAELRPLFAEARAAGRSLTLLDLGTGAGDIPEAARRTAARLGVAVTSFGLERTCALATASAPRCGAAIAGDGLSLPFASGSIDLVTCSQVLHHFSTAEAVTLLREMHRVASQRVIVSDLRRAWVAVWGIWAGSYLLGFHPVSRHDGMVSVRRGFRVNELFALVLQATGHRADVRHRAGFRLTASWTPEPS